MPDGYLPYRSSRIHFSHWGQGSRVLFCFHGYGESGESFESFSRYLPEEIFTLVAVDLPCHGQTLWAEPEPMAPSLLAALLRTVLDGMGIKAQSVSLLGFSMGGRMALALLEQITPPVEKMILLAPDGLKESGGYRLATRTRAGNRIFRFCMKHPFLIFSMMNISRRLGWISAPAFRFMHYYIQDEGERNNLYRRWTALRKFRPRQRRILSLVRKNQVVVWLVFGEQDPVILSRTADAFRKAAGSYCQVSILDCGHQILQEKNCGRIAQMLTD
jgi:pimeloyl-ACP methyl ester carboxylesterase